jgi:hypothetical protein
LTTISIRAVYGDIENCCIGWSVVTMFIEYLAANGSDVFDRKVIRPISEVGIWGAIRHHGLVRMR